MTGRRINKSPGSSRKDRSPARRKSSGRRTAAFQDRRLNSDGVEIVSIFGFHAVAGALANPARDITRLMMSENAGRRLDEVIRLRGLTPEITTPKALDKLLGSDTVHQGVVLETVALAAPNLEDLIAKAQSGEPIVVLDQITDPHNVGAILRSCAVFGAGGLVMTRRNSPALSGALAKAASGALELVGVHLAANLARTLDELRDHGVAIVGLDGDAETAIEDIDFSGPCAIVLGAEGKGLRQLTKQNCSKLARIEALGTLASLNVSNAAAVTLHVAAVARRVG